MNEPHFPNDDLQKLYELVTHQSPVSADAIVWPQGDRLDRGPKVAELFRAGLVPFIVVTGNNTLVGVGPRPGENDIHLEEIKQWLLQQGITIERIIIDDTAHNTQEQAKNIIFLAKNKNWRRLILVSSPYHQIRLFLTFLYQLREQTAQIELINQPALALDWGAVPSGRTQTQREILNDEINKLDRYQNDIASVSEGIAYLKNL